MSLGIFEYGLGSYGTGGLYPVTDKITISDDASYNNQEFAVGADVWIGGSACDNSNILCKYTAAEPEWYFGYSAGMLRFVGWDVALGTSEHIFAPYSYHDKWCRMLISYDGTDWRFYLEGTLLATVTATANTRNIGTADILSGMTGYIRDIIIWNKVASTADMAIFFAGGWVEQGGVMTDTYVKGIWPIDDDNGTVLRDASPHGNDGAITGAITGWDNGADDLTFTAWSSWVSDEGPGRMSEQLIFNRDIHTENPTNIIIERTTEDPYREDNYDSALKITDITDDAAGVIITFDKPFKTGLVNTLTVNDALAATDLVPADITIPAGTEYTWSAIATDLDTYTIRRLVPQDGGFKILFNTSILSGSGSVTGIDVAWIDYTSRSATIWTNDTGEKTVVISGFMDVSGNIIPANTEKVLIPATSTVINYDGSKITNKKVYGDSMSDKIGRETKNWIDDNVE